MRITTILIVAVFFFTTQFLFSENNTIEATLSKGLTINASDSSFSMKIGLILQPRFEAYDSLSNCNCTGTKYTSNAMLRRMRLRFEGFIGSPALTYFYQFGFTDNEFSSLKGADDELTGVIFDAFFDWEFVKGTKLRVGQFKLPGSFSRLISFTGLNFPERSNAESMFNSYRDIGLQVLNEWKISYVVVREQFAFTHGEGVNQKSILDGGYAYSGRLELLPLGLFDKSGDTYELDRAFEKKPKLLIGGAVFCDNKAQRERGVVGKQLYQNSDITSYFADFLFKFSGFALQGEYYKRQSPVPLTKDVTNKARYIYVGEGYSGQVSYMITEDMAFAMRYSLVRPSDEIQIQYSDRSDYSLGFTKFIYNNKVKLQTDLNYSTEVIPTKELQEMLVFRINMIISI